MIAWLMTNWLTQIATVAFAIWFARGVWKATMRPRLTYVSHQEVKGHGTLLTVKRQELLPPWRMLEETWLLPGKSYYDQTAIRESDGSKIWWDRVLTIGSSNLCHQLYGLHAIKLARDAETDELLKQEARPN